MERLSSYFHPIETGDARVFLSGVVELFARYPEVVIERALDVSIGIPAKHTFWPRINEIKKTLDDLNWPVQFERNWNEGARQQIAERTLAIEHQKSSPSRSAPRTVWHEAMGISKAEWDAIPNRPDTFMVLPAPKEDTAGPPGEDAA